MPSRVAAAQKAIASTARLETLRFLLRVDSATRPEVIGGTGMSAAAARDSLAVLEELGYVTTDTPMPRIGRVVHYQADRAVFTDDLAALVAWTLR